jgi:hypothetical protein
MPVHKGDPIQLTVDVDKRQCFFAQTGKPGGPVLSFPAGTKMTAGDNELGGNVFGETVSPAGDDVLVPLGEKEFTPAT